jgi:hypothetical protein
MKRLLGHVIIPAIIPAFFFAVAATPAEVMGCRNRGLIAVLVALIGALAALGAAIIGVMRKVRGDLNTSWWVISALVLAIPAVAIIIIVR